MRKIRVVVDQFQGLNEQIKVRYNSEGPEKLALEFGTNKPVVVQRARKLGIRANNKESSCIELDLAIKERYYEEGPKKLAEDFGVSKVFVTYRAGRLGIQYRYIPGSKLEKGFWSEEKIDLIRKRYPCEGGSEELQKELGVSWNQLVQKAADLKIKFKAGLRLIKASNKRTKETDQVNTAFFDIWTKDSAYVLGYIWADGCITNHSKTKRGLQRRAIAFGCSTKDKNLLEQIKKAMKLKNVIWDVGKNISRLQVTNTYMANRLQELHKIPSRKTYKDCSFPDNVPDEFMPHFLRGFFDGDGSVAKDKKYLRVQFYGTKKFLVHIGMYLIEKLGIENHPLVAVAKGRSSYGLTKEVEERLDSEAEECPGVYYICWQKREDVERLFDFLYPEGEYIFLPRKHNRLANYLGYPEKEIK